MYLIKEMPLSERPRERLVQIGAKNLADHELIAIIYIYSKSLLSQRFSSTML